MRSDQSQIMHNDPLPGLANISRMVRKEIEVVVVGWLRSVGVNLLIRVVISTVRKAVVSVEAMVRNCRSGDFSIDRKMVGRSGDFSIALVVRRGGKGGMFNGHGLAKRVNE